MRKSNMEKKEAKQEVKKTRARAEMPAPEPKPSTVSFDAWWAMVAKKMPQQHRKEVVKADFLARGLSANESVAAYHEALKLYGVKLK